MAYSHAQFLEWHHLPGNLIELIREGRLEAEVERAYRDLQQLNDATDQWELDNPEAAKLAPWFEAREAWKRAGRPQAPWYEVLRWATVSPPKHRSPIQSHHIDGDMYYLKNKRVRDKLTRERRDELNAQGNAKLAAKRAAKAQTQ